MLLNDRYQLGELLGRGGMGAVYRARDILLDRGVAVKLLNEGNLGQEARERMLREAKAIAKLNHPNIVQVHDAGELAGTPFIVMELVEGPSLHDRPPHGFQAMVAVARQICEALEHAHSIGIVHRDLKPENVLIGPDGIAKLMDFGLARSGGSRITSEGQLTGTVFYMAPEVALGSRIDGRADLYSLGVMLYEMAAGQLPFSGGDPLIVISQHLYAPVESPRARNPRVPIALEELILGLLAKSPEDRPGSAGELAGTLATLESIVAVGETYEPPQSGTGAAGPAGWASLLRNQWRTNRGFIRKRAVRGARGAALGLALFGATRPLQVALASRTEFEETVQVLSLGSWVLLGAFAMALVGGGQGLASGFLVGLADAFVVSRRYRVQRLLLASVAGLAHTTFLVLFSVLELFVAPTVGVATYVPLYVLFGLFLGAELSYVYPVLGTTRSTSEQLKTSAWVTLVLWAAAVPLIYFTYREQTLFMLPFLLGFTAFLVFGVGFALGDRRKTPPSARA